MISNSEKYRELIEKIEKTNAMREKFDLLAVLLYMIATNDLDSIYKHIKRLWIGIAIILATIFLMNFETGKIVLEAFLKAIK